MIVAGIFLVLVVLLFAVLFVLMEIYGRWGSW